MAIRKRTWGSGKGRREAWVVDYFDQGGTRRLKTFSTKREATDWWTTQGAAEVKAGTHTADSASIAVGKAADLWVQRAELEGLEPATVRQYRNHADTYIKPLLGETKLSRLTQPAVEEFRDKLLRRCPSRATAKKVLTSLKGVLKEAKRRGYVAQNVAQDVSIKIAGRDKYRPVVGVDIPTREEVNALLRHTPDNWRAFAMTAVFAGLRASELRGLRWADVDLDKGVLSVRQRADENRTIGATKSESSRRDIRMSAPLANALREWKLSYPRPLTGKDDADGKPLSEEARPEHLVFPNSLGNVEDLANINRKFLRPVQMAAGLTVDTGEKEADGKPILAPKYALHKLRHFFASWLIGQGYNAKRVQRLMGHSSINVTLDIYTHLLEDGGEEEQEQMDKAALAIVG